MNKKGQVFKQFAALASGIAGLVIALTVTFLVMSQAKTQEASISGIENISNESSWTAGFNATSTLQSAVGDIPGWVPLIVVAVIGSVLLGLVALFRR